MNSAIDLLSAYVSNNHVAPDQLVGLLQSVNGFIRAELGGASSALVTEVQQAPSAEGRQTASASTDEPKTRQSAKADVTTPATTVRSEVTEEPKKMEQKPAVPISDSVPAHGEYIICLEDGHRLKTLKRHLGSKYQMTPDEYRRKWNLPPDYPMTARAYSESRSALAKASSFGKRPATA